LSPVWSGHAETEEYPCASGQTALISCSLTCHTVQQKDMLLVIPFLLFHAPDLFSNPFSQFACLAFGSIFVTILLGLLVLKGFSNRGFY